MTRRPQSAGLRQKRCLLFLYTDAMRGDILSSTHAIPANISNIPPMITTDSIEVAILIQYRLKARLRPIHKIEAGRWGYCASFNRGPSLRYRSE